MAVYFYYGEEDYGIEQEINKLKSNLDKNFLDMSFKTYSNPKFADLISILRSQSMMFGRMLIVIKCLKYFSQTFDDKEIKQISEALEDNNPNIDIVFVAELPRDEDSKLDSRKKLFKLLSKYNAQKFDVIPTYKTAEFASWIKKEFKNLTFDKNALETLIAQIGNNLRELHSEIEKLQLYIYPQTKITTKHIKEICTANESYFAFLDFIAEGEKDKALLELRKILMNRNIMPVLASLQTTVRKFIILKLKSSTCSMTETARLAGYNEYYAKLQLNKLKNTSLKDLIKLKLNLTDIEYKIKSGQSLNPEKDLEDALFY